MTKASLISNWWVFPDLVCSSLTPGQFKGEGDDDLRQDAVMEQVFQLVNVLLDKDDGSKRRNLSIRTYKVIPLASQAGVLQFVENTQPLSAWLIPAHHRYIINVSALLY